MNCIVCGLEFWGQKCPRCGFPVVESVSEEALHNSIDVSAAAWRERFLKDFSISLAIRRWQIVGEELHPAAVEYHTIGTVSDLLSYPLSLPMRFARLPEAKELSLSFRLSCKTTDWSQNLALTVPNILSPGFQRIYICSDKSSRLVVHLTNEDQTVDVFSDPASLL